MSLDLSQQLISRKKKPQAKYHSIVILEAVKERTKEKKLQPGLFRVNSRMAAPTMSILYFHPKNENKVHFQVRTKTRIEDHVLAVTRSCYQVTMATEETHR